MAKPHTPTQTAYLNAVISADQDAKTTTWSFLSEEKAHVFRNQVYKILTPYRKQHLPENRGFDPKTVQNALSRVHVRQLCGENNTFLVRVERIPLSFSLQRSSVESVEGVWSGDYNPVMSGDNISQHSPGSAPPSPLNLPRPPEQSSTIPPAYPRRTQAVSLEEESEAAFLRKLLQQKEQS